MGNEVEVPGYTWAAIDLPKGLALVLILLVVVAVLRSFLENARRRDL
jgi:hypothetical protein